MDANCKIEFGDVDLKLRQTYIYDTCVEFPTSWPEKDCSQISFGFEDLACDIPTENTQAQGIENIEARKAENVQKKNTDALCNGIHDIQEDTGTETVSGNTNVDIAKLGSSAAQKTVPEPVCGTKESHRKQTESELPDLIKGSQQNEVLQEDTKEQNAEVKPFESFDKVEKLDWAEEPNDLLDNYEENEFSNSQDERTTKDKTGDVDEPELTVNKTDISADQAVKTSWAGLFRSKGDASVQTFNGKAKEQTDENLVSKTKAQKSVKTAPAKSSNNNNFKTTTTLKVDKAVTYVETNEDPDAEMLAERLDNLDLIYKPQAFIPRGLMNISNWCYINATLQALLVCPPLFQLLKCLPVIPSDKRRKTSTPILDSFVHLASEFRPLSSKKGYQSSKDVRQGPPFEPRYIYDMLSVIKSTLSEKGRQEDAEEFQTCVLNGLHEEMTKLLNLRNQSTMTSSDPPVTKNGVIEHDNELQYDIPVYEEMVNGTSDMMEEEWEEVVTTKKNRSAVTRRADITRTPISAMFRGELCTSVFRPGQKISVSLEPFFSLPLDVPSDHSWSVDDALISLTGKENFQNEKNDDDASRQQTLEVLPPILILHLKRFVYDKNGGLKKIDKRMEYKTELVVAKDLLSKSGRKLGLSQRSYKLFAVLYHHGDKATGGHYSTDVFHIGVSSWLRIDDQSIRTVTNSEVTRHSPMRTAYLLYYRRTDLG
uniref:ubiquitinyl hydrolase 1 n=1 Tax=Phallusia mammillata TaxID=59560 RepID=A0A6F9DWZ3_9ASCI|nr:ubiquitin carboxyl-terminal hydrolase 10-like [Phallusia mammillata]